MKKYLLPSGLILGLFGVAALAQTFTRAIQLSQDTTGAFSVDTNNFVYFPGHILFTGTGLPAPTIAGTATPTISGTDASGLITMGTSATTATATFGTAYLAVPNCIVMPQAQGTVSPVSYTPATTSIAIVQVSGSGNKYNYWCTSTK